MYAAFKPSISVVRFKLLSILTLSLGYAERPLLVIMSYSHLFILFFSFALFISAATAHLLLFNDPSVHFSDEATPGRSLARTAQEVPCQSSSYFLSYSAQFNIPFMFPKVDATRAPPLSFSNAHAGSLAVCIDCDDPRDVNESTDFWCQLLYH
jgi:hypothetical protein